MKRTFPSVRTLGVLTVAAATLALSACVVAPLPHRHYVRGGPVIIDQGPVYHRGPPPRYWDNDRYRDHDHRDDHHGSHGRRD